PAGCGEFLEELLAVKDDLYSGGRFQMQFSIHSTSAEARRKLVPCRTLSLSQMAGWGSRFRKRGDRKIALNFAAVRGYPVDPGAVAETFSPEHFMIKLTPVNPTRASTANGLSGVIDPDRPETADDLVGSFEAEGFDVVLSIGETRENQIGSNCGMYVGTVSEQRKAERPATVP
ncbi:MAG: hypothetical protein JXA64_09550, partial [Candidatus Fermentibacteraceae bacterium]|nr:hypothetical protein [Candidatus Fermentibacteraceae bacterium]